MSGGSFNYLCWKDPEDIIAAMSELRAMADELTDLGYAEDAAAETEEIITIIQQFERRVGVRIRRLSDVWHAVEWWRSNDGGEDGVKVALAQYRGENEDQKMTPPLPPIDPGLLWPRGNRLPRKEGTSEDQR